MRIAFGAALPVGVGGNAEIFDLFLTEYVAPQKVLERLQGVSPQHLYPIAAEYIEHKAPAASVAYPFSTYEVHLSEATESVVVPTSLMVTRKKKEKVLEVQDFLRGSVELDGARLTFTLESKPTGSLRADAFVAALIEETKQAGYASEALAPLTFMRVKQSAS
jgi:radical SAM-linked protein